MSRKLRRRVTMAAGATIAGAAIPIAAAFTAWADDVDISYDGMTIFDNFDTAHPFGSSDVGTEAVSGVNGDYAEVVGPAATDDITGLASDNTSTDSGDVAFYDGSETTAPTSVFGEEGASVVNATNSDADVFGGGNAAINLAVNDVEDQVTNSSAIATNGGFADVANDGLAPPGVTVTDDYAVANGTATLTGATAATPSVATVYDSGSSVAIANDTGTNEVTGNGGSAVDLANNSFAYSDNVGSAANIIGTGTASGTPVVDSSNVVGDGDIFNIFTSNTFEIDGIPDATFFGDLFGAGGAAAEATAMTDLMQLFAF